MLNVKTEAGVRVKRERGLLSSSSMRRDGSFIQTPIYKVTVKAHFQIPNKSGHRFKCAASAPSKKLDSDEINSLEDLQGCLRELSCTNIKCGEFDVSNLPAMRMLDYLGGSKEFCTRDEEIQCPPIEFQNITCAKTIDIGICNLNMISSSTGINQKRKATSVLSSSTSLPRCSSSISNKVEGMAIEVEDDSVEFVSVKPAFKTSYLKAHIPLKFDLLHGRIESSSSSTILTSGSSFSSSSSSKLCQKVVLYKNHADFQE